MVLDVDFGTFCIWKTFGNKLAKVAIV